MPRDISLSHDRASQRKHRYCEYEEVKKCDIHHGPPLLGRLCEVMCGQKSGVFVVGLGRRGWADGFFHGERDENWKEVVYVILEMD